MSSFSSTLLSPPPGSSPFPPASPSSIFSSAVLSSSSSSRLRMSTSSLSPDRLPSSRALKSSSSVLWLSVTMTSHLSLPLSPAVSPHSFSPLSTPPSASFSRSTFCRRQSSFPLSVYVPQPYRTHGKTIAFIILISVSLLAFLFFHISHTSSLHCHSIYLLFASTFAFYHGST